MKRFPLATRNGYGGRRVAAPVIRHLDSKTLVVSKGPVLFRTTEAALDFLYRRDSNELVSTTHLYVEKDEYSIILPWELM